MFCTTACSIPGATLIPSGKNFGLKAPQGVIMDNNSEENASIGI